MQRLGVAPLALAGLLAAQLVSTAGISHAETDTLVERARGLRQEQPADRQESRLLGTRLAATADSLYHSGEIGLAAGCLESAGILAARRNDLDRAIGLWERGLDWARSADAGPAESSLLNALAIGHSMRGDVEAALPVYGRAIDLRSSMGDTLGLSRTWGNLAQVYANAGRLHEALEATAQEEDWLDRARNPTGRIANALRRAQVLVALQRTAEAAMWAERALELSAGDPASAAHGLAWMRRGDVELELGEYESAQRSLARAVDVLRAANDHYSAAHAEQMRLIALYHLGRHQSSLDGARALERELDVEDHDPLRTVLLRLQGQALFALGRRTEAEALLRRALEQFETRRRNLGDARSRAGIFLASGEIYAALARCRLDANDVAGAFDLVERGRAPLFRDRTGSGQASRSRLRERLDAERAALVLFNDPRADPLVAFVLHADDLAVVEIGPGDSLVADARAAARLLAAGETLESCGPILDRLSSALAAPVLDLLPEDVERSYVVPPSTLIGFPLELLRDDEGRRWGERAPMSLLPNASALVALAQRRSGDRGFLALADPTLRPGVAATGPLPESSSRAAARVPLPHARREVSAVAPRGARVLVGDAATAQAFRSTSARSSAVLHLATHASVDAVDGSRSAILLAGPDGVEAVAAAEILEQDLPHDLVVLSGCSTFGGDRTFGEGWFGLPRAFLSAGSRSVVSTLWDVEDSGARRFVELFYAGLREGMPRDRALAAARGRSRELGLPPREWAAFVLTGLGDAPVEALVAPAASLPAAAVPLLLLLSLLALRGLSSARPSTPRS